MRELPIRSRSILDERGTEKVERLVECPAGHRSVPVEACRRCGYGRGETFDPETGEQRLECDRALECDPLGGYEVPLHVVPALTVASRNVFCVTPDARVEDIKKTLLTEVIGCVPVVDAEGKPIGIVSALDLLAKPLAKTAAEAMTYPVASVPEAVSLTRAAALMAFEGIHHLPIVNGAGGVVAMLSSLDVLRHVGRDQGYLLPSVSRRRRAVEEAEPK